MKYSRFEDLPVWQAAINLKLDLDDLCEEAGVRRRRNWIDQLDRASLSISNNIAEGFERGTTNELLMFLYIARGSVGEVRSLLHHLTRSLQRRQARAEEQPGSEISDLKSEISNRKSEISDLKSEISKLISQIIALIGRCESISRQLHGWANSLQNGDVKGVRHLTEQNRQAYHQRKLAEEFWQQNRRVVKAQMERRLREVREPRSDDEATQS